MVWVLRHQTETALSWGMKAASEYYAVQHTHVCFRLPFQKVIFLCLLSRIQYRNLAVSKHHQLLISVTVFTLAFANINLL